MAYLVIVQIANGLSWFFRIVTFVMVLYAFLSWFVRPDNAFYRLLARFCQPILAPFRPIAARLMYRGFPFDVSYILAFFAIQVLQYLVMQVLSWILMLI